MAERYLVLGLAPPRQSWPALVTRWAATGSVPVEFVSCVSAAQVRAHLATGRRWCAALVDVTASELDRDLLAEIAAAGAQPVAIGTHDQVARWTTHGTASVVESDLDRRTLLSLLEATGSPIRDLRPVLDDLSAPVGGRADVVVVTGAAGSGTSLTAAAVARGASLVAPRDQVVLADLALWADQAVVHHLGDVLPGLPELLDQARRRDLTTEDVRACLHPAPGSGHTVLPGLRRHRDWPMLRTTTVEASFGALARASDLLIVDCDPDVEGAADTGSDDVEDRNLMARTAVRRANVVAVTFRPDPSGLCRLVRHLEALHSLGVDAGRLLPVGVGRPRRVPARAELLRTVHRLTSGIDPDRPVLGPLLVSRRRDVERAVRDGEPLPAAFCRSLAAAVRAMMQHAGGPPGAGEPEAISPGSLGVGATGAQP